MLGFAHSTQPTKLNLVNNSGTLLNHFTYDSFGTQTGSTVGATVDTRYKFTGREFDGETGDYFYRSRYYDPEVGRFLGEDAIGFASGDANLYRYVENNSISSIDPFGQYGFVLGQLRSIVYNDNGPNLTRDIRDVVDARNRNPNVAIDLDITTAIIIYSPLNTGTDTRRGIDPPDMGLFDDRGHIVGRQLGGNGRDVNNLFAQLYLFNQIPWRLYETSVTNYLNNANQDPTCLPVNLAYSVTLRYPSQSNRRLRPNFVLGLGVFTDGKIITGFVPN
jgi:RHS repeat-associated protein